jgi:hypothetical protein
MPSHNTVTSYTQVEKCQIACPKPRGMCLMVICSLLHKLKWKRGDAYGEIAKAYADVTVGHYKEVIVVFDGYQAGPSIKDNTHQRWGQITNYPLVNFTKETEFEEKKEEFLSRGTKNTI